MKKLVFVIIVMPAILFWGCGSGGSGELYGVQGRLPWFQPDPYGMLYLPMGAYHMGPSDQDVPYAQTAAAKSVSVQAFYMDQTEITNNEYRQFVYWVRDSLARRILGEEVSDEYFHMVDGFDQELDPPQLNWDEPIYWNDDEQREALDQMSLPEHERFYRRKRIDTRKLNFEYYRIDLRTAAQKSNREQGLQDRSVFIIKDIIGVYPDTLAWVHDFTYSFNEPMTRMYFWHPAYDNYPVVGVNWRQARAFCIWRSELLNSFLLSNGGTMVNDFRLPTESEWEYASRGGLDLSPYPWGGPYIRNSNGCFLANFKPMRGNYIDDGGFHTVVVTSYSPNEFGLYCMSGNVAEWTSNAYDEAAYNFAHDLNQDYLYEAKDSDPPALKRKVIRGGSWKDIAYYLQNGTRTYEYQDTAKCYIGFRSVMTYLGRAKGDEI
jgi:gliding motility-associated lipoprotein GldK